MSKNDFTRSAAQTRKIPRTVFGRTLRDLREGKGISQSTLAEACECDHSAISRLEAGFRNPSRAMAGRIAAELGLDEREAKLLMGSAGFSSEDFSLLAAEVEVSNLLAIMADPGVPDPVKENLRVAIAGVVCLAREVARDQ